MDSVDINEGQVMVYSSHDRCVSKPTLSVVVITGTT